MSAFRGAVLWLALVAGCLVASGCGSTPTVPSPEQEALAALDVFSPVTKRNDKGRVVELELEGKTLAADSLDHVAQLSELKRLSLYGSSVTDRTLGKLADLKSLEALGLAATPVTDAGLAALEKMPNLRWLWLSGKGKVTPARVEKLKQTLPGLIVYLQ